MRSSYTDSDDEDEDEEDEDYQLSKPVKQQAKRASAGTAGSSMRFTPIENL